MNKPHDKKLQLSTSDCYRQILLLELKAIKKWRKVAIKGADPEGMQQIRVSLRKMRTALVIFKPLINTKFSRRLAKDLRNFGTTLDDARDLDVYLLNSFSSANQPSTLYTAAKENAAVPTEKSENCLKAKCSINACSKLSFY